MFKTNYERLEYSGDGQSRNGVHCYPISRNRLDVTIMYFLVGLFITGIGIYDAVTFAYKKNTFGFKNPILIRYAWPTLWVVVGIVFALAGFHV